MHSLEFVKIVTEAAEKLGINVSSLSTNWAINLQKGRSNKFIVGYTLPINNAACYRMARSKNLCYEVLNASGINAVPHELLLTPTTLLSRGKKVGNLKLLQEFISKHNFPFLIKRNNSSKGDGVFMIGNEVDLENTISQVYTTDSTLCLCPYRKIQNEYRNVVLNGRCLLTYEKQIPYVTGDGKSLIIELLANRLKEGFEIKEPWDKFFDNTFLNRLTEIPQENEKVFLHWKHNATLGSHYEIIEDEDLKSMAIQAAKAIDAKFVTVDIIRTEIYGYEILEINASVVLNAFSLACPENHEIAVSIFKQSLLEVFNTE